MARRKQDSDKPKNPPGRPTLYKEEYNEQVTKLCLLGATDVEIANFFNVDEATIYRWKNEHPLFCEAIKEGKIKADSDVAKALHKRALGYTYVEAKEEVNPDGSVKMSKTLKEVAPDTAAAFIWLKNRQSAKWRDKQEVEHSGEIKLPTITVKRAKDEQED